MNYEKYSKNYNDDIQKKINYFIKLWEHFLPNVTSNLFGLTLYSPHLLLKDLLDEYKYNQMKNSNNKDLFKKRLESYKMTNPIIIKFYSLQFNELNKNLGNGNYDYLNELTNQIYSSFSDGKYFYKCLDYLIELIFDENGCELEHIKQMTNDIIIEFMLKGVPIKQIEKNFKRVLDDVSFVGDNKDIPVTDFPLKYLNITYDDFKNNQSTRDIINNLDIKDRLKAIKSLYITKEEKYYIIIKINGLTTSLTKPYKIKDIEFYSPRFHKKISDKEDIFKDETDDDTTKKPSLNAYIPIKATNPLSAYELAKKKLDSTISLLRITNMGNPYCEIADRYIVLNSKKEVIMSSYGKSGKYEQDLESKKTRAEFNPADIVGLSENNKLTNKLMKANMLLNSKRENFTVLEEKLYFSLKWIINAEDNDSKEERLMSYWIAIENLVNLSPKESTRCIFINKKDNEKETKVEIAQELIASIHSINLCLNFTWNFFYFIRNNIFAFFPFSQKGFPSVKKSILDKCNIKQKYNNNKVSIMPFIKNIDLLKSQFNDYYMLEKFDLVEKINKDNNFAYDIVKNLKNDIKEDVLYLYRYRNLISHNAHLDMTFLEYYSEKAKSYSIHLFLEIMDLYSKNKNLTPMECLINIKIKKDLNVSRLKNKNINNFYDILNDN